MSATSYALLGFITWTLLLLIWMEILRTHLVVSGRVPANGFAPDNAGRSPFLQRLARAHANCIEGLPIFGGLMALAMIVRADQHRHLPGRVDADGRALVKAAAGAEPAGKARRRQAAGLDIGRIAEAAEFPRPRGGRLAGRESGHVRCD